MFWAGPDASGAGPLLWGGPLYLAGKGLGSPGTALRIDGEPAVPLDPAALSAGAIEVTLDTSWTGAELPAGIHVAQAVAPAASPEAPEHLRRGSNPMPFALHPAIVPGVVVAGKISVGFTPAIVEGQSVTLTLDRTDPMHSGRTVLDPDTTAFPASTLTFLLGNLDAGNYLVRAHVDGLASLPEIETDPASPQFGGWSARKRISR